MKNRLQYTYHTSMERSPRALSIDVPCIFSRAYTDENGEPGQLIATTEAVTVKADAPRSFVRLPFQIEGGVSINSHGDRQAVWIGEQAFKPQQSNGSSVADGNAVLPPRPLDLACFGFTPSNEHRACVYTPQPFLAKPKQRFSPASVCSNSLSIYATTVATGHIAIGGTLRQCIGCPL